MDYDDMVKRAERAARRYARSKRKTTPETRARVRAAQFVQAAVDDVTRKVIDEWGVSTVQRISYMTFGRSVWALLDRPLNSRMPHPETLTLVNLWVERGLEKNLLVALAAAISNRHEEATGTEEKRHGAR